MVKTSLKVCLAQIDIRWKDKEYNKKKCASLIKKAAVDLVDLIIFPEMTLTGCPKDVSDIVEDEADSATITFFRQTAKKYGVAVIFGVALKGKKGMNRNMAFLVNKTGRAVSKYQKMHPFSFDNEHKNFSGGKELSLFKLNGVKMALVICYDLRFPGLFEAIAKYGPEAIIVIASWPKVRVKHWRILLQARSLDTQAYVIGVNRAGRSPVNEYNGYSSVYSPNGERLIEIKGAKTATVVIDKRRVQEARKIFSSLADKKPQVYSKL